MRTNIEGRWGYSTNEENYHGDFETRNDAIAEAAAFHGRFTTAQYKSFQFEINPTDVIEQLKCDAYEFAGEVTEEWLDHIEDADLTDLNAGFNNLFFGWMVKNGYEPQFWGIDDTTIEHHVMTSDGIVQPVGVEQGELAQ